MYLFLFLPVFSFIVESAEGKPAKVKVVEGAVAFAPRVPALEKLSEEEISKNGDLKKLQESIAKAEVILEKDQASTQSVKSAELAKSADIQSLDLSKAFKTTEKEKLVVEDWEPRSICKEGDC